MSSKVIGLLVISRHGDREGFYQNPATYTASATSITALGEVQENQLGSLLRSKYLDPSSASYIQGTSLGLFDSESTLIYADASDEGGVIYDSAIALAQGLWPPAGSLSNTTLANGTTVVSPLSGYQDIPITSILANEDFSLEGWNGCPAVTTLTNNFYSSSAFKAVAAANADFLANLTSIVTGRPTNLENMWNIFDFMNVQSIHNATFLASCPPAVLARARALANYHEAGIFSSGDPSSVGNIAGSAMLPTIISSLNRLANTTDPLLMHSISISYKPFLSLFQMMNFTYPNGNLTGIINYAGSTTFEVRVPTNGSETPFVRVAVKNGTDDADYVTQTLFNTNGAGSGQVDVPLSSFVSKLQPYALETRSAWCSLCNNNSTNTCDLITELNSTTAELASYKASHRWGGSVSPVGAGFIGMGLTLALVLALLGIAAALGLVTFGRRGRAGRNADDEPASVGDRKE